MAKKDAEPDFTELPDAFVGVSPEYQNYANPTEKPLAAPGDEIVLPDTPNVAITLNPDGTPAGSFALVAPAEVEVEVEEDGAADDDTSDGAVDQGAGDPGAATPPPVPGV